MERPFVPVRCQLESERLAYTYMLNEFRAAGNTKMVRKLEKFPIDQGGEVSTQYLMVRSQGMMKLGIGIMRHIRSLPCHSCDKRSPLSPCRVLFSLYSARLPFCHFTKSR